MNCFCWESESADMTSASAASTSGSSSLSRRVLVVPSSIMRARIARVAMPALPAPRMMRSALYWARLSPEGSITRDSARRTTEAVRSSATVASWPVEWNAARCPISCWTLLPVSLRIGTPFMATVAMITNTAWVRQGGYIGGAPGGGSGVCRPARAARRSVMRVITVLLLFVLFGAGGAHAQRRLVSIEANPIAGTVAYGWARSPTTFYGIELGFGFPQVDRTLAPDSGSFLDFA